MKPDREMTLEVTLWEDGIKISRPALIGWNTRTGNGMRYRLDSSGLGPDGSPRLQWYDLVSVGIRHVMPVGKDWLLVSLNVDMNGGMRLAEQTVALRAANEPDAWPTGILPIVIPLFDHSNNAERFLTWYLTVRCDGARDMEP